MEIKAVSNPVSMYSSQYDPIESCLDQPQPNQPFIAAILYLKEMLRELLLGTTETHNSSEFLGNTLANTLHFGVFLNELDRLKKQGLLFDTIRNRRDEITQQKEHWRSYVEEKKKGKDQDFYKSLQHTLLGGKLIPNSSGSGSSYFIVDNQGVTRYIAKPVDEDIFCLNNRREFGSVFNDYEHRVRRDIPLYRSAQTDALCWEVACLAGLETATPQAVMEILHVDEFYDFTTWVDEEQKVDFMIQSGFADKEKLASIQEFIPDSQDLIERLHDLYNQDLSDEEIASRFDQKDFEEVCMFLWLSYDNDANGGNFCTFVKRIDQKGREIYGIKKIDNALSFPEKNTEYVNILAWLPNAILPLSPQLKQKIERLPVEEILKRMEDYELSNCQEAFKERVEILKELAQRKGITVGEIDLRFSILSMEGGKEIALGPMTTEQLIDLLREGGTTQSIVSTRGPDEAI